MLLCLYKENDKKWGCGLVKLFYESNIEIDEVDLEKCMEVFFGKWV